MVVLAEGAWLLSQAVAPAASAGVSALTAVLIGVLSSFVASLLFLMALAGVRPRIFIAPKIARDGEGKCKIKIVNRSRRCAFDVHASLYLVEITSGPRGPSVRHVAHVGLTHADPFELPGYRRGDQFALYAGKLTFSENIDALWVDDEHTYLEFKVRAVDSFSGMVRVRCRAYRCIATDIVDGRYEHGRSVNIVPIEPERATKASLVASGLRTDRTDRKS